VHTVELTIDDPDAGAELLQLGSEREPGGPAPTIATSVAAVKTQP
jgi:hypothetical protein